MTTFSKALVAVDLEQESAAYVVESALQLVPASRLSLIHVLDRGFLYNLGDISYAMVDELREQLGRQAKRHLEQLGERFGIAEHHVLEGHPASLIQQHAHDNGHDLIVLGTHGRHGIRRLLGSTANAVLHGTERNVLAVRVPGADVEVRRASDKYRHLLAAVDLSDESHQVVDIAQQIVQQEHAELHVVHVVKPFQHTYAGLSPATLADVGLRLEEQADEQAHSRLRSLAASRGLPPETVHVRRGAPHLEIQSLAEELRTDLLVVGTHGKHGFELLLGSVANAVLHGIRRDVLAVRIR